MPSKISLKITRGERAGEEIVYSRPALLTAGRGQGCGLSLPDGSASRYHCLLRIIPPFISVRDLQSANGVFINENQIGLDGNPVAVLKNNDRLALGPPDSGEVEMNVSIEGGDTALETPVCAKCGPQQGGNYICRSCAKKPFELINMLSAAAREKDPAAALFASHGLVRPLVRGFPGHAFLMRELKSGADTVFRIVIPDIPPGTGAAAAVLEGLGALSKFSNPFIAAVKDRGFAKGVFFSVQEYCAGMTAAAAVKKSGPLPESKAVDAALGILSALESPEAAGQDAPHGFLSPDGVLLPDKPDTDGPVKIIDFGLTQAFGAAGPSSPEPPAGLTLFAGARTVLDSGAEPAAEDVRDCAALLYFMLSGFYPRDPEEGKDPWLRVIQASPVPLAERAPGLPPGLCAAVDAALAENGDPALKTVPGLTAALREATRR